MDAKSEYKLWNRAGLTKPLYVRVRDALAERILTGEWRPGTLVPSEYDIAAEFGVSPGTARKALALLEDQRVLQRRERSAGHSAVDESNHRFRSILDENGEFVENEANTIRIAVDNANEMERRRLRLGPAERVFRLRRCWSYRETPFMVEDAALPLHSFPDVADGLIAKVATLSIGALAHEYGIDLGKLREQISMTAAPEFVVDLLGIAPNSSITILDRVVFALNGRPFEWRIGYCVLVGKYYLVRK